MNAVLRHVAAAVGCRKIFVALVLASWGLCGASGEIATGDYKTVGSGVKYQLIGEYSVDRLNKILTSEVAGFSSFPVTYPPAGNAVKLYKVIYNTVIPEDNNRPVQVSGLVAVPEVKATTLPVVSYQHGTVFSQTEAPSAPEQSMETRLMVARFAGQGYVVVAADYVGKGGSHEPDGWLVKEVTAQACLDMWLAAQAVCADLKITPGDLFLSGWSQGSFSTLVFLHRLETVGIPVKGAAMASSPNDIYMCFNRWIHVPSELDVHYLVGTASMLVFAYENYYGLPGLSAMAIKPEYLQTSRDFYHNKITWEEAAKVLPEKSRDLFQEEFLKQGSLIAGRFWKQLEANRCYDWRFKTPTHFYFGKIDEVVTPFAVNLPVEYQKTVGGAPAEGIYAGDKADHRGTFLFGVNHQKQWFDQMRSK